MAEEIRTQPDDWQRAAELATRYASILPRPGERIAVVGCGSSALVGRAYAARRERAGLGRSDAFVASEFYPRDAYDRLIAITRSGTTSEVLRLLARLRDDRGAPPTVAFTASFRVGDGDNPVTSAVNDAIVLDFADERSFVQTRFGTATLALLRAHLGEDLGPAIADARRVLAARPRHEEAPALLDAEQFTFLGSGPSVPLAEEAALKLREAAGDWTEAYPAMEYRHGPIAVAAPRRVVWSLDAMPDGLADAARAAGATVVEGRGDPMAELIAVQQLAEARAVAKGRDPDRPRPLARSVILS